jgi:hypothetical protein
MKVKQWEKPQIGVVASGKRVKTGSSIRTGKAKYHLGPAPVPPYSGESLRSGIAQYHLGPAPTPTPANANGESLRIGKARYHLGPAPTPLPDYMGPAPAPFLKR